MQSRRARGWRSGWLGHWGRQVVTLLIVCGLVAVAVFFRKPLGELKIDPWVAAIFLALVFNQPIADRIRNLRALTTPIGEAQFEKDARELAEEAEEIPDQPGGGGETLAQATPPREEAPDRCPDEEVSEEPDEAPAEEEPQPSCGEPPQPPPPPEPDLARAHTLQYENAARERFAFYYALAADDPTYAMIKTRDALIRVSREALRVVGIKAPRTPRQLHRLVEFGLSPEVPSLAAEVMAFGNEAAHHQVSITPKATINYIRATERVVLALVRFIASTEPVNENPVTDWLF